MNTIKRYWIYESLLITIAIAAFAFAAFRIAGAGQLSENAPENPAIVTAQQTLSDAVDGLSGETERDDAFADEDDSAEMDEDVEAGFDEDSAETDEGDTDEPADDAEYEDDFSQEEGEFDLMYAAAQYLQLEPEQVESAVNSGLSYVEIATRAGADVQAFTDTMVAQELAAIDALAQSGEIPADELDEAREEVQTFTPFFINTVYFEPEIVAARTIGIDVEVAYEQIDEGGKTIAQIAEANGVAAQTVIDAIVASETQLIDEMVTAGLVESDEADEWKAELSEEMTRFVMETFDADEGEEGSADED